MPRRFTDTAAVLSLAAELGHGQLPEHQLRVAVLATRLANVLGLGVDDQRDCFDSALLRWLGCTAVAQPLSARWGDEIAAHQRAARFTGPLDPLLEILGRAGAGRGLPARLAIVAGALAAGPAVLFGSTCEASTHLAERLGYGPGVITALGLTFERFDSKGWPGTLRGAAIPPAAQIAMITDDLSTLAGLADLSTACAEVARGAGTRYDPVLVRALEPLAAPTAVATAVGAMSNAVVAKPAAPTNSASHPARSPRPRPGDRLAHPGGVASRLAGGPGPSDSMGLSSRRALPPHTALRTTPWVVVGQSAGGEDGALGVPVSWRSGHQLHLATVESRRTGRATDPMAAQIIMASSSRHL